MCDIVLQIREKCKNTDGKINFSTVRRVKKSQKFLTLPPFSPIRAKSGNRKGTGTYSRGKTIRVVFRTGAPYCLRTDNLWGAAPSSYTDTAGSSSLPSALASVPEIPSASAIYRNSFCPAGTAAVQRIPRRLPANIPVREEWRSNRSWEREFPRRARSS